jgi:hypothetical protein
MVVDTNRAKTGAHAVRPSTPDERRTTNDADILYRDGV